MHVYTCGWIFRLHSRNWFVFSVLQLRKMHVILVSTTTTTTTDSKENSNISENSRSKKGKETGKI